MATILINDEVRRFTAGDPIARAEDISTAQINGLTGANLQAVLASLFSFVPLNATGLTNTPSGNLTATNVQAALNELQAELDLVEGEALTSRERRILNNVTEGASFVVTELVGGSLTVETAAMADPPEASLPFQVTLTGLAATRALFFQVTTGTSVQDLVLQAFTAASGGERTGSPISLADAVILPGEGQFGSDRYRSFGNITFDATLFYRINRQTITYTSYTLSDLFSIAASRLTGVLARSQLDNDLRTELQAGFNARLSRLQEILLDEFVFNETVTNEPQTAASVSTVLSSDPNDYQSVSGGGYIFGSDATTIYIRVPGNYNIPSVRAIIQSSPSQTPIDRGKITTTGDRVFELTPIPNFWNQTAIFDIRQQSSGTTVSPPSKFKISRDNLDAALQQLLLEVGTEGFSETIDAIGQPPNNTISSFHYLPLDSLPQRDLALWTSSVTANAPNTGLVPQFLSSVVVQRVILLPSGTYPNTLTWNLAADQPAATQNNAGAANLEYGDFLEVSGLDVPEGYQGFIYNSPPFTAASSGLGGGSLRGGQLALSSVRDIQFSSEIQIRDENLNLSRTQTISEQDRDRLNALSIRTYVADTTESAPNNHYDVRFACLWPDPRVRYEANNSDPLVHPQTLLPPRPEITGIIDNPPQAPTLVDVSGFNGASVEVQPPPAAVFENIQDGVAYRDQGPGLRETATAIRVVQNNTAMNADNILADQRGLIAICTMNIKRYGTDLVDGTFYPIIMIGNRGSTPNQDFLTLGLKGQPGNAKAEFTYRFTRQLNTSTHQRLVQRETSLRVLPSQSPTAVLGTSVGQSNNVDLGFQIPSSWDNAAGVQATLRLQLFEAGQVRSLFEVPRTISNLAASEGAFTDHSVNVGGNSIVFQTRFFIAGDPFTAGTPNAASDVLIFRVPLLTNTAETFALDIPARFQDNVTLPAGSEFDTPLGLFAEHSGGRYDIALFIRNATTITTVGSEIEWRASINGRNTPFINGANNPWYAGIGNIMKVEYGGFTPGTISRLMVLRPKNADTVNDDDMSGLSFRTSRNELYAGLLRKQGEPYRETFGTAANLLAFKGPDGVNLPFGSQTTTLLNLRFEQEDGINRELDVLGGNDEDLVPRANFTAMVTVGIRLAITNATVTSAATAFRNFLEIIGEWRLQQPAGGAFATIGGIPLNANIERNLITDGRVEGGAISIFDFEHSRTIQFERNHVYQFRVNVRKVNSNATAQGWPTTDFGNLVLENCRVNVFVSPQLGDTVS